MVTDSHCSFNHLHTVNPLQKRGHKVVNAANKLKWLTTEQKQKKIENRPERQPLYIFDMLFYRE